MQTISTADLLRKKFIGTDDLRRELTDILDKLPDEGGEIVITQHGKPQAILLGLDAYIELQEQIADSDPKLISKINNALDEAKKGKKISAQKVFEDLGI